MILFVTSKLQGLWQRRFKQNRNIVLVGDCFQAPACCQWHGKDRGACLLGVQMAEQQRAIERDKGHETNTEISRGH